MYILENTVLIQSSRNFIRMLVIIISRSSLKLGHLGSKTRWLGQILEKPCVHSRRHSFYPKFMKLCQIVNHHNILVRFETGHVGSKTRSLGQILEKKLLYTLEGTVLI